MKILEVNVDDIGNGGVFSLVRNVIRNKPAGAVVDIAAIEPFERKENIDELARLGCSVHYVGRQGSKALKQFYVFRNVKRLVRDGGYTVVHIHSDVANKLLVSALAARAASCRKVFLHSHATGVDGNRRLLKRIFHYACRPILKCVGTDFLTCSDLAARWMFPNVKAEDVKMVKNGVDLEKFRFSESVRTDVRRRLGIENKLVIGHVGRFAYQKNHDYLIDVFRELRETDKSATLLLVGEGALKEDVMTKVQEYGLTDSVIFYGASNNVPELFMAMDVFVLPSHFEGLPIVGVEAQAAGLPCLFADTISRDTQVAQCVDFLPITHDAIGLWVEKIEDMKEMGRKDNTAVMSEAGFSIRETVVNLWSLYSKQEKSKR